MKIIIAGGRGYNCYTTLKNVCDLVISDRQLKPNDIEIVSGGAKGADTLGEQYAKENNYPLKKFPADWELHGKSAGYIRNKQMAEYGDILIAFWDGESKGTKHMIDLAHDRNLDIVICYFK